MTDTEEVISKIDERILEIVIKVNPLKKIHEENPSDRLFMEIITLEQEISQLLEIRELNK